MVMEKIYFDEMTFNIIKVIYSDRYLKIYEYGRFNDFYERVNMKFKLYSNVNTLQDLFNYMDKLYTPYNEGDKLFITENDQHYVLNTKKQTLRILGGNKYSLMRCCYNHIYRTADHELYVLDDKNLSELFVIKKSDLDSSSMHLCELMHRINVERSVFVTINYNRIKYFEDQLQLIGYMVIDLDSDNHIEFNIKFHETPNFEDIKERCCIYNMMKYVHNSHYYRENDKRKLFCNV